MSVAGSRGFYAENRTNLRLCCADHGYYQRPWESEYPEHDVEMMAGCLVLLRLLIHRRLALFGDEFQK